MRLIPATLLSGVLLGAAFATTPDAAAAEDTEPKVFERDPKLDVNVAFETQSPLGVTVVNGHITKLDITVDNNEPGPLSLEMVGGALWKSDHSAIISNLTSAKVGKVVKANEKHRVAYSFIVDMQPQDVILELGMVMVLNGTTFTRGVYNGTVSVVEPETSLLDPQLLFLYFVLLGVVGSIGYFAYSTWVVPLLPKKQKRRQQPPPTETIRVSGADVGSGTDKYDESWIPEHHIKKQGSTRIRGRTPRSKESKKVE